MYDLTTAAGEELKIVTLYDGDPNSYIVNINVKNIIPDKYKKLTIQNFGITYSRVITPYGSISSGRGPYISTYDPETGILSVSTSGDSLTLTSIIVKAWYV